MKYEYKTTIGRDNFESNSDMDPIQPNGDGWEMCGMAAAFWTGLRPRNTLYWSWRRVVKKSKTVK